MSNVTKDTNLCRTMMNAVIQWQIDSGMADRIHVIADATLFDVTGLERKVDGLHQIVLSIGSNAVRHFRYNEHSFSFEGRYDGVVRTLDVPYEAVLGFTLPTGENTYNAFPIPNMERELFMLKRAQAVRDQIAALQADPNFMDSLRGPTISSGAVQAKPITPAPFAVVGVDSHDEEGNKLPSIADLMDRKPFDERVKPVEKEVVAPLLDFGHIGSTILPTPKRRRVGAPHLTLIQGGKA